MCGIAGFLNYSPELDPYIDSVARIQYHRGPDHQAVWRHNRVALCHQRLSIIDLSDEANQPMVKDGLIIVFNGELYNYQEVKQQLIDKYSVAFTTASDTEVVLEAYRHMGTACLSEFKGMFALAIYTQSSGELFLARDPFGIKPLFYYARDQRFSFASELKTLVQMPGFVKNINHKALVAAVNYLWLPESLSMFKEVNKLPAGSYLLRGGNGEHKIVKYYQPVREVVARPLAEAVEQVDQSLRNSIARHMVADVPVSTFLSGGLDSSLIAVLAREHNPDLATYSINIQAGDQKVEQMPDDARYARELAAKFGFNHHEITITPQIADYLPRMVYHLDEPIGDPAAINTYLISEEAKKNGSKVLLSGMGADEIFFGYRRQMATLAARKFGNAPRVMQKIMRKGAALLPVQIGGRGFKPGRWAQRFASFAGLPPAMAYMRSYSYYDEQGICGLFTADIIKDYRELLAEHEVIFNEHYQGDIINQMCQTDSQMFMNGLNLTYTDRASMAASVEVRVPFIDREVVDLAMTIPGKQKYHQGKPKGLLKLVAEKYLPPKIVHRPKASFGAPIRSWISGPLSEMVQDLLNETNIKNRGIFNYPYIKKLIQDDRLGRKDNAYQIYELLTLELWFRTFVDHRS